jgi:hypothetical protein
MLNIIEEQIMLNFVNKFEDIMHSITDKKDKKFIEEECKELLICFKETEDRIIFNINKFNVDVDIIKHIKSAYIKTFDDEYTFVEHVTKNQLDQIIALTTIDTAIKCGLKDNYDIIKIEYEKSFNNIVSIINEIYSKFL